MIPVLEWQREIMRSLGQVVFAHLAGEAEAVNNEPSGAVVARHVTAGPANAELNIQEVHISSLIRG